MGCLFYGTLPNMLADFLAGRRQFKWHYWHSYGAASPSQQISEGTFENIPGNRFYYFFHIYRLADITCPLSDNEAFLIEVDAKFCKIAKSTVVVFITNLWNLIFFFFCTHIFSVVNLKIPIISILQRLTLLVLITVATTRLPIYYSITVSLYIIFIYSSSLTSPNRSLVSLVSFY